MGTMDNTQLEPVRGKPFFTQPHIVSCYKMITLEHSVCAHGEMNFQRLQQITRLSANEYNDDIIAEFRNLCEGFTFVSDWSSDVITPHTYRIYTRQLTAKEATQNFMTSIRNEIPV